MAPFFPLGRSLTARLASALVGSLALVALALGAGGAAFIEKTAEQAGDRLLGVSPKQIADTLAVENGRITLDVPPSALSLLETPAQDSIYYGVWHGDEFLTGYADLPRPPTSALAVEGESFRYGRFHGAPIRIAAEVRRLPRIKGPVLVEVAETLGARRGLSRSMLIGLAALEAAFVATAALLVWPTLHWALRPLTALQRQMDRQPAAGAEQFARLQTNQVPIELLGLVSGFNALLDRLDAAIVRMRAFTADASHQMRTPLAVLRTHIAVLRPHVKPKGVAALDDVELAAARLQHLLTSLIVLARADETSDVDRLKTQADLREVAARVVADLDHEVRKLGINLRIESAGPCLVAADPLVAAEILKNLVDNAIKYNRPGGEVLVSLKLAAGEVVMTVEDDGPGIPPEHREQALQRFFRLSRDQHHPGSGLGLPIVNALTRSFGGRLELQTREAARGLKVTVSFPEAAAP